MASLPPEIAARHATVIEKAKQLLNQDSPKLDQFKSQVSSFRRGDSTASELIDTLWDIFNTKLDEFGKLITSTADLFDYDAKPKRTELLGAWNDWKIQVPCSHVWANLRCKQLIQRQQVGLSLKRVNVLGSWRSSLLQRADKARVLRVSGIGLRLWRPPSRNSSRPIS